MNDLFSLHVNVMETFNDSCLYSFLSFYVHSSSPSSSSSFFDECPEATFDSLPTAMVDPAAELCDEVELAVAAADVTTLTKPPIKLLRKLDESDPRLFYFIHQRKN